jgi:hypothetical protein
MRGQTTADKQDAPEVKMTDSGGYSSIPGHTTKFGNPLTNQLPIRRLEKKRSGARSPLAYTVKNTT